MRLTRSLLASGLLTLAAIPLSASGPAVVADPNPAVPGQKVTLRWYFTGDKVLISGGRFGKGTVVTGRTSLTDTPRKPTRYTFDVWYRADKPTEQGVQHNVPLRARYTVLVQVARPQPSPLTLYRDTRGWQVGYLKGWKHDSVSYPDPANNALIYFQKEDDSVERLAVSMLPAESMTCSDLTKKVQDSLPTTYDDVKVLTQADTTHAGAPAILTTFSGMDQSHPGTRTQSVVLTVVRDGHAFVISARTAASLFAARRPVLEKMVRSFALTATRSATRN